MSERDNEIHREASTSLKYEDSEDDNDDNDDNDEIYWYKDDDKNPSKNSVDGESGDKLLESKHTGNIRFTGITVGKDHKSVPGKYHGATPESTLDVSVGETVHQIRRYMEFRPIATVRAIQANLGYERK